MKGKRRKAHSPSLEAQMKRLRAKVIKANRQAARGIETNIRKFGIIASAVERDLKKLKGAGTTALRAFRNELKKSWKDLKRVAHQQF